MAASSDCGSYTNGAGVARVRSCDVAGRHRESTQSGEQELDAADRRGSDVLRRLRGNGGMVLLIAGVAVPAVLGGVIAVAAQGGGGGEKPAPRVTTARTVSPTPRPRPRAYPTYGEYVPPRVVATVTRRAPVPRETSTATPSPSPRVSCPPDWWMNPWLRRWCRMHGFGTQ